MHSRTNPTSALGSPLGIVQRGLRKASKLAKRAMRKANQILFERPTNRPVDPATQRGGIAPTKDLLKLERLEQFPLVVNVLNTGNRHWGTRGKCPTCLLVEWKSRSGETLVDRPKVSVPLPAPVRRGETVQVTLPFQALHSLGNFRLELSIGQGFENRFHVPPAFLDVDIDEVGEEFDYHAHFASFDLEKDYWTVVGPTTEPEYHRLAGVKRQHLIDLGLKPDSKILDVGCGTGQLASALVDYLSARGEYWGTELALPGVEWCKRKYNRPNFRFFQNEMTTIPISGVNFDFISYFSVFTHTYPDDNRALLLESKRLLAPKGCIFADFFTSSVVEDYIGHRGAVENNHEKLLALFAEVGLKCEEVFNSQWHTYGKRRFMKLTHA